jgi:hypothetical protein
MTQIFRAGGILTDPPSFLYALPNNVANQVSLLHSPAQNIPLPGTTRHCVVAFAGNKSVDDLSMAGNYTIGWMLE